MMKDFVGKFRNLSEEQLVAMSKDELVKLALGMRVKLIECQEEKDSFEAELAGEEL